MGKKGFTLIELLAVFIVLSIILGMVVVNVVHFSNNRKEKDYKNIVSIIEKNTDILVNDDQNVYKDVNEKLMQVSVCKIDYEKLEEANLMDKGTINPKTGKEINRESYIKIELNMSGSDDFEYTFIDKDFSEGTEAIESCLSTN